MNAKRLEVATLGGGCFWCLEGVFEQVLGVESVVPGYCGGHVDAPTYHAVCTGNTGHAEVVRVVFDSQIIAYESLLEIFFAIHDPTTLNRQGNDVGTQYRSGVYVSDPARRAEAEASRAAYAAALAARGLGPITTEILDAPPFYFAEAYHQQYLAKVPHGYCGLKGTGVACAL